MHLFVLGALAKARCTKSMIAFHFVNKPYWYCYNYFCVLQENLMSPFRSAARYTKQVFILLFAFVALSISLLFTSLYCYFSYAECLRWFIWCSRFSAVRMSKKPSTALKRERDFHASKRKTCFATFNKCGKVCNFTSALYDFRFLLFLATFLPSFSYDCS